MRFFDVLFSTIAIFILSPLLLIISLILMFTGEGEVFYKQIRIGKDGKEFGLFKFATMKKSSPSIGTGELTLPNDSRVLPFGKFLRKTKLNELPQLFNVLFGDISLIGPRPQTIQYFMCYDYEDRILIQTIRPGLSGIASIIFRDEENLFGKVDNPIEFDKLIVMPYKGKLEKWYVLNQSILLYFQLIFKTIKVVIFPNTQICNNIIRKLPEPPNEILKINNLYKEVKPK